MRSRQYVDPELGFLHTVRIVVLSALGAVTSAAVVLSIAPGRSFDLPRGLLQTPGLGTVMKLASTTDGAAHPPTVMALTVPQTDGAAEVFATQPIAGAGKSCEDGMWSFFNSKCLSIATRRKHHAKVMHLPVRPEPATAKTADIEPIARPEKPASRPAAASYKWHRTVHQNGRKGGRHAQAFQDIRPLLVTA